MQTATENASEHTTEDYLALLAMEMDKWYPLYAITAPIVNAEEHNNPAVD